jgi:hypothetical protein
MVALVKIISPFSLVVLLSACLSFALAACSSTAPSAVSPTPTDVTFVIPSGTEAALERGEPGFQFPEDISVPAGRSVVITNNDYAMHYFFDIPVAPGQTIQKPFPRAGDFVYQGGLSCSISRSNTIRVHAQ